MAGESGSDEHATSIVDNERRREVVRVLSRFDEPVTLPDLAEEIAIRELEKPITEINGDHIKDLYLLLYHSHVPALVERGLVKYDQDADLVTLSDDVGDLAIDR